MSIELQTLIEATLFGAGKSMSVGDLSLGLKQDESLVSEALHSLQSSLKRRRGGALQVVEISGKWALEVKPSIAALTKSALVLQYQGIFVNFLNQISRVILPQILPLPQSYGTK